MLLKDVKIEEPIKGVVHLIFPTKKLMALTFLRFQESYESPKFKDKVFTFEEYKTWYISEKGKFSYVEDWPGFNIPSGVLRSFREGKYNPLSAEEKDFLSLLSEYKEPFYIIGTSPENGDEYKNHEFAHAFLYVYPEYREQALGIVHSIPPEDLKEFWNFINIGYHESVKEDEIQAHLIANLDELVHEGLPEEKFRPFQKKLLGIYKQYSKR